ncbi:TPA: hypothetical protein G8M18_001942 [Salmonella enterica]|nr:hypothetical protein [Salmonella enterica]
MSLREIASHHGISEGAIRKRAKRADWSRDLNARIQQKADDLVRKQEVRKTVRTKIVRKIKSAYQKSVPQKIAIKPVTARV